MAESSYPAGAGTRVTTDSQFEALGAAWAPPGVYGTPADTPVVYADGTGTRVVKVRANKRAQIRGWGWTSGTSDISMPSLAANGAGSTRFDTVVLRFSRSTYTVVLAVVQGVAGSGVPALTQSIAEPLTSGTFELPLATVAVAPGATTIAAGSVTNVAWYAEGDTIVVPQGAGSYLPPVSVGAPRYRAYDTAITYELVAGAWRRTPWLPAWGFIGGKRYHSGSTLAGPITSEALAGIDSGSISLEANRRYRIHGFVRVLASVNDISFTARIRETNLAGAVVVTHLQIIRGFGASFDYYLSDVFTTSSSSTKTYVMTLQANAAINSNTGTASAPVGIWLEDLGPSTPAITVV